MLELPFSEDEIKEVVFQSNPSKAPGPDGMSFLFYQQFWENIKEDIILLVNSFYQHNLDFSKLNHACICLIPKTKEATTYC